MFKCFRKKKVSVGSKKVNFELELTASILAYEVARSDGGISQQELEVLLNETKK